MRFKRLLTLWLLVLACLSTFLPFSLAEETQTAFVAPTLSPDANAYDPEHPELLEEDQLYATAAILMEANSGLVIFEKNADEIMYPASTTKILTVLLGIELGDMNETVTVSSLAAEIPSDASSMNLHAGETINFRDLLYGTMLRSANEGANAIAETISGSISAFADLMNQAAAAYGCTSTHFTNPNGLHDDNHYTTARDMAIIARVAMQNETFREICATTSYSIPRSNMQKARTITLYKNKFMTPGTADSPNDYYYAAGTGIKTGSTNKAGYCYVGSASKDGVDLISVVLYSGDNRRWMDTIKLMDYGFAQYVSVTPIELYEMNPITIQTTNYSLTDTDMGRINLLCRMNATSSSINITATKASVQTMADNIRTTCLFEYTRDFVAPIEAGETVGTMTYITDEGESVTYDLVAARSVAKRENAPKTLEEIVDEVESDPNPWPPITLELVAYLLVPVIVLAVVIIVLRKLLKHRRSSAKRTPKPTSRYLK